MPTEKLIVDTDWQLPGAKNPKPLLWKWKKRAAGSALAHDGYRDGSLLATVVERKSPETGELECWLTLGGWDKGKFLSLGAAKSYAELESKRT